MKNKKFEVKNLLGNSQKRTYRREVWRQRLAGVAWTLFIIIFAFLVYNQNSKSVSPEALKQTIDNNMIVEAVEQKPICKDAISCIRDIGESLGKSNTEIRTMIRIAQKESNIGFAVPSFLFRFEIAVPFGLSNFLRLVQVNF